MRTSEFGDQAPLAERLLAELTPVSTCDDGSAERDISARGVGGVATRSSNKIPGKIASHHYPDKPDGSHDASHLLRVWRNARTIAASEPGSDPAVLVAAVILHDCVAVEKNAPERSRASRLAAVQARAIVGTLGWDPDRTERLAHAIEAHSFSAGITPRTIEARILQDADRLDAIGAIGVARCFYVAGRIGSALYSPDDPAASTRQVDDRRFALDHFRAKLFTLTESFQTATGQTLANQRARTTLDFFNAFLAELGD